MGNICGLRRSQASAWPEVATFLIKRKWPKIDQGGPWTPLRRQGVQGGSGLARHWFHGRFQASALPLVEPWAVLRSDSHPAGGVGPACRSIRGRIRASTGPLVGLALPGAQLQGGGRQPSPPAVRGGIWASATPWVGCGKWGPKGSREPLRIQWRARLPGPSGSLSLRRTAHSFTRGRAEAWNRP